jgi:hypothetical protein
MGPWSILCNSFVVFSDYRSDSPADFITNFIARNDRSQIEDDLRRCFCRIRAVVYVEYRKGTRIIEPHHRIEIRLRPSYRPLSADDLYLWAVLNGAGKQLLVFIRAPPWFQFYQTSTGSTRTAIPCAFQSPAHISRIFVSGERELEEEDDTMSLAFGTALSLASYSRGYWGTHEHRKGGKKGVLLPSRRTDIDMEMTGSEEGISRCISMVRLAEQEQGCQLIANPYSSHWL